MTLLWRGEGAPDETRADIIRQDATFQARMRAVVRLGRERAPSVGDSALAAAQQPRQ